MSASLAAVNRPSVGAARELRTLLGLGACFVLSGSAALVYQTAWMREFALAFGTSEPAVATVLAAYMAGLAAGAALVERFLDRIERPVIAYAALELGIGASAVVLVPLLLAGSETLLQFAFGGQESPPSSEHAGIALYYLGSAFVVLAAPTMLMGATLPLLARYSVRQPEQIGRRIGLLYAFNTAGAVAGALLAAFVLLPRLGLRATIWCAAALNLLVFLLAAALAGRTAAPPGAAAAPRIAPQLRTDVASSSRERGTDWILPLMLLAGVVSFTHEVLWTRLLGHVLGSSIHAFGAMLASFLTGIALGGAAGAVLARERERASRALAASLLLGAAAAAGAFLLLEAVPPKATGLAGNALLGVLLLLPLTVCIGATYPLAVRILAADVTSAAAASARIYGWNTVGAIAGALLAGFVIIPALRYEGAIRVAVAAGAALGIAVLWLLTRLRRSVVSAITLAALAGVVMFHPGTPERLLRISPLNLPDHGRIAWYNVGRSASVVVLEQDGGLALRSNGLPEAAMETPGQPPRFSGEFWLAPLAVLARPDATDILVVGYGGGVVIEAVPPSVQRIETIEIEPEVIAANRATRALRKRDPLSDPRLRLITNDARGALALTTKRYDAIVSQPSHPWTAGASHLYTREFMQLAREHLSDDGVFVQWMNVAFLDEPLLRALAATLITVFADVRIYRPDPNTLVFLASMQALEPERGLVSDSNPIARSPAHYARYGIEAPEDVLAALAADAAGVRRLAGAAAPLIDDTNRIAISNVYERGLGLTATAAGRLLAASDPLRQPGSWVYRELRTRTDFAYLARRLVVLVALDASHAERLQQMGAALGPTDVGAYVRAVAAGVRGASETRLLREAAALYPDSELLHYTLMRTAAGGVAADATSAPLDHEDGSPLGELAAAVITAQRHARHEAWAQVAALEPRLAAAPRTAPWWRDAMQLRMEWRVRVSNPDLRRRLGEEAITLADRALLLEPTVRLHALRARAALAADRPEVLLESLAGYAQGLQATLAGLRPTARSEVRRTLDGLLQWTVTARSDARLDQYRVEEVRRRLEETRQRAAAP